MKIVSNQNILVLSKKELVSKNDKNKKLYKLVFFIPETEETHNIFISKEKFDMFEINNMYGVEITYLIDEKECKISIFLS